MTITNSSYSVFTEKGQNSLPDDDVITELLAEGIEPVIFLDSCVCLHIIKIIDFKKKATNVDFKKVIALKEYLEKHPRIRISPFFAFLELCNQNGQLDKIKFRDFKLRIDFFNQIPLKSFKKFSYDFQRDILIFKDPSENLENPLDGLNSILKNSYCTLLKIRSIAIRGVTKKDVENNLNELVDWMIRDLDIFRGAEYMLAMNIFGGNTTFRKMIGLDSKRERVKQKLIGTTWDMFHSKFTANNFRLSQILERNIYSFFLTSDANLFSMFKMLTLELVKDGGQDFLSSFIMMSGHSFPHLDNSFVERNNERLINIFIERRNQKQNFDEEKVDHMIDILERENNLP